MRGADGFHFYTRIPSDERQVRDILIEDCQFIAYGNNILTGHVADNGNAPIERVAFRRCHFLRNWNDSRSQGLYHVGQDMGNNSAGVVLLEECFFDHNGWLGYYEAGGYRDHRNGQATFLNHNTYFTSARNILMLRNIFTRPSSIQNKFTGTTSNPTQNIVLRDNLFIEGEVGLSAGGNSSGVNRFKDMVVEDNIYTHVGRDNPTKRNLAGVLKSLIG